MSEESLANKKRLSSSLPEADYDLIYATLAETAQGRRFLEEYARRCRLTETEAGLAAVERIQAVIRGGAGSERLEMLLEMADMAQAIVHLRAEILAMRPAGIGSLEATEELDSIVNITESATSRILAAAEQVQEIAWTMRETGSVEALCDELNAQVTAIYTACSFQDLTGQRTRKVIQVLRYLEDRINAIVVAQSEIVSQNNAASTESLLQAGVDAVMQPEAPGLDQGRQDATLEDISRQMLAIEPTIGLTANALQEAAAPGAALPAEEVKPELSVSETVLVEAHAAAHGTDWVVDVPAPAKGFAEGNLADWVVEYPQAPQPETETSSTVLGDLEAECDKPAPASTSPKSADFVAEAMSQLAEEFRPSPVLPSGELMIRGRLPEQPALMQRAAAMVAAHDVPSTKAEDVTPPDTDLDDFLFAPEEKMPARAAPETSVARPGEPATAESAPPPAKTKSPDYDPLSPLRAMSDAQKIALFS